MTGTGLPPTLLVRVDIATLNDLAADHGDSYGGADGPDAAPDPNTDAPCDGPPGPRRRLRPPAELDWGGLILRQTLERIGCTAQIIRLVADGPSRILDLGRAKRIAAPAQKLALAARDKGCVFPGCDRPPAWTDVHHTNHWANGGATDIDHLALLCRFHHLLMHEGGWTLRRTTHGIDFINPDGDVRGHHSI